MSLIGLNNQVISDSKVTENKPKENKPQNSILEEVQKSFKYDTDNAKFDPRNQKEVLNTTLLIVKLHDEYETYSLSEKSKLESVTGLKNNVLSNLSNLKTGESEIKFRFETDINKNCFEAVSTDPKEYGKNKDFYYVNGINTDKDQASYTKDLLSSITGQKFIPIHNETDGIFSDLIEASRERFSSSKFDMVSLNTALKFSDTLSKGRELKIVAHSQGAAITADALKLCEKLMIYNKLNIKLDSLSTKDIEEADKKAKNAPEYKKTIEHVNKIMNSVEVITMGGAASQDQFPNVKLVEILNSKDPVPKLAGTDNLETSISRKTTTLGKVSYDKTNGKVINNSPSKTNAVQHFIGGALNLKSVLRTLVSKKAGIIDYHSVDSGKYAYLNQANVKSLLYNFGRQDFK